MLGHLPQRNLDFLRKLSAQKRTFLLSNTNDIHIRQFFKDFEADHGTRAVAWEALFERAHYSFLMGMRKPEPRIYQALVEQHGLTPSRTVFIDDNAENVSAALKLGFQAVRHPTNDPLPERFSWDEGSN
jgi:glucose-1-phosphatase